MTRKRLYNYNDTWDEATLAKWDNKFDKLYNIHCSVIHSTKPIRILIISEPRVASNTFSHAIRKHFKLRYYPGELVSDYFLPRYCQDHNITPHEFMELLQQKLSPCIIKCHIGQLVFVRNMFKDFFIEDYFDHIIRIERKDKRAQARSNVVAHHSMNWENTSTDHSYEPSEDEILEVMGNLSWKRNQLPTTIKIDKHVYFEDVIIPEKLNEIMLDIEHMVIPPSEQE